MSMEDLQRADPIASTSKLPNESVQEQKEIEKNAELSKLVGEIKKLQIIAREDQDKERQECSSKLILDSFQLEEETASRDMAILADYSNFAKKLEINVHPISNFKLSLFIKSALSMRTSGPVRDYLQKHGIELEYLEKDSETIELELEVLKSAQLASNLLWLLVDVDTNRLEMESLQKAIEDSFSEYLPVAVNLALRTYLLELPSTIARLRSIPLDDSEQNNLYSQVVRSFENGAYKKASAKTFNTVFRTLEIAPWPISKEKIVLYYLLLTSVLHSRLPADLVSRLDPEKLESIESTTLLERLNVLRYVYKKQKNELSVDEEEQAERLYVLGRNAIRDFDKDFKSAKSVNNELFTSPSAFDATTFPILYSFETNLLQIIQELRNRPFDPIAEATARSDLSKVISARAPTTAERLSIDFDRYALVLNRLGIPLFPISPSSTLLVALFHLPTSTSIFKKLNTPFTGLCAPRVAGSIDNFIKSFLTLRSSILENLEPDRQALTSIRKELRLFLTPPEEKKSGNERASTAAASEMSDLGPITQTPAPVELLPMDLSKVPLLVEFDKNILSIVKDLRTSVDTGEAGKQRVKAFLETLSIDSKLRFTSTLTTYDLFLSYLSIKAFPITIPKILIFTFLSLSSSFDLGIDVRKLNTTVIASVAASTFLTRLGNLKSLREASIDLSNQESVAAEAATKHEWVSIRAEIKLVMAWHEVREVKRVRQPKKVSTASTVQPSASAIPASTTPIDSSSASKVSPNPISNTSIDTTRTSSTPGTRAPTDNSHYNQQQSRRTSTTTEESRKETPTPETFFDDLGMLLEAPYNMRDGEYSRYAEMEEELDYDIGPIVPLPSQVESKTLRRSRSNSVPQELIRSSSTSSPFSAGRSAIDSSLSKSPIDQIWNERRSITPIIGSTGVSLSGRASQSNGGSAKSKSPFESSGREPKRVKSGGQNLMEVEKERLVDQELDSMELEKNVSIPSAQLPSPISLVQPPVASISSNIPPPQLSPPPSRFQVMLEQILQLDFDTTSNFQPVERVRSEITTIAVIEADVAHASIRLERTNERLNELLKEWTEM